MVVTNFSTSTKRLNQLALTKININKTKKILNTLTYNIEYSYQRSTKHTMYMGWVRL